MPDLFTEDSPFVQRDSRRTRPVLPTTAQALNAKHEALMPLHVVQGRTVLDLGCCIGATGYWAVQHGAARYVGVELQEGFAKVAGQLLAADPRAAVVTADSEAYLNAHDEPFDVVAMLGLVHGLYDPLWTIRRAARLTREFLCFEDFGSPSDAPVLVAEKRSRMPIAGERAGTVGFGWSISPLAMEHIMDFLGFAPDMAPEYLTERRWMCRYQRVRSGEAHTASHSPERLEWT